MNPKNDPLSGWTFTMEEVSAGVYKVRGVDKLGRSVEMVGTDSDPNVMMNECRKAAAQIAQQRETP